MLGREPNLTGDANGRLDLFQDRPSGTYTKRDFLPAYARCAIEAFGFRRSDTQAG
jgi:hypothetical protein